MQMRNFFAEQTRGRREDGFTLMELLIVMAISLLQMRLLRARFVY